MVSYNESITIPTSEGLLISSLPPPLVHQGKYCTWTLVGGIPTPPQKYESDWIIIPTIGENKTWPHIQSICNLEDILPKC